MGAVKERWIALRGLSGVAGADAIPIMLSYVLHFARHFKPPLDDEFITIIPRKVLLSGKVGSFLMIACCS